MRRDVHADYTRFLAAIAVAALAASPASAHITLEKREATIGTPYKAVFVVPHGCAGSATIKIRVQIPEGVIAVKPMPKAGWNVETVKGKYASEYDFHGAQISEGVKEVAWSGGKLPDTLRRVRHQHLSDRRSQAEHHAVFSGRAGMRAGRQPLDRYPGRRQEAHGHDEQIAGAGCQADAEAVKAPTMRLIAGLAALLSALSSRPARRRMRRWCRPSPPTAACWRRRRRRCSCASTRR